jgi:Ca-activated chloride channel homolog
MILSKPTRATAVRITGSALIVSALLLGSTARSQQQDDDVIRVNSDLVVLNATVLDKQGKFVSHLRRADFQVFENGEEQKLSSFSAEETPFAAAILIDTSGSMESRMTLARGAAISFLEGLRDEDMAAVYTFDSKAERRQDFSALHDLPAKVFTLHGRGQTVLNDAVLLAADDLAQRPEKRRAIIVVSDGGENFSRATADKALEHALRANATIYAVNMSPEGPTRDLQGAMTLKNFTDKSGGTYVSSPGGQAARDAFAEIVEELSHQYTLAYRPTNRERDGKWRAIDLKVSKSAVTVRTRKGYRAPKG